jgi:hypothetical protein
MSKFIMSQPKYVLRLNGQQINGSSYSCTGEQLALVICSLQPNTEDCTWFITDLEVTGSTLHLDLSIAEHRIIYGGNTEDLIKLVGPTPQLLSGVFLSVPKVSAPISWGESFYTDDPPFRDIGPARFELRVFDTTYIEIYAHSYNNLEAVASQFKGQIITMEQ